MPAQQLPAKACLSFDSRFESGNLAAVIRVTDLEYDLILQNDVNTQGYIQWFFFKVHNHFPLGFNQKVRFNIINHTKTDSLFNYGMRVLTSVDKGDGAYVWQRSCTNIEYY